MSAPTATVRPVWRPLVNESAAYYPRRQQSRHWLLWFYDVCWPWSLTFSTENWHSTYSCPGQCLYHFYFSTFFVIFELRAHTGQTERQTDGRIDGRARRVMQPIGRPHNNQQILNKSRNDVCKLMTVTSQTAANNLFMLPSYNRCISALIHRLWMGWYNLAHCKQCIRSDIRRSYDNSIKS